MPFHSQRLAGRIVELEHESQVLGGNPLGDPVRRSVFVYLPPDYDETRRFPTVMLLPGFLSNHVAFFAHEPFKRNVVEVFDDQVVRGESPSAILVMPDATNRWGGSQFLDSPATGAYQTYLAEEVMALVDRTLRTIPAKEARAVVGKSSGGFGALRLVLDRHNVFSAAGSHAGDADFEVSFRPMWTSAAIAARTAGGVEAFLEGVRKGGPRDAFGFDLLFVCAASAAYASERGGGALGAPLPFDPHTGLTDEAVFAGHTAHDPIARAHTARPAAVRGIFLDGGDRDEHGLQIAAEKLATAFGAQGVRVEHETFEGGHRGTSHRYARSIPWLVALLERERATPTTPYE